MGGIGICAGAALLALGALTACSSGSGTTSSHMEQLTKGTAPTKQQAQWEAQMACTALASGFATPKTSTPPGGKSSAQVAMERAEKAAALDPTYASLVDQLTALGTTAAAQDSQGFGAAFETVSAACQKIDKLEPYKY